METCILWIYLDSNITDTPQQELGIQYSESL